MKMIRPIGMYICVLVGMTVASLKRSCNKEKNMIKYRYI